MRHEDDLMSGGVADRDLPFLRAGVIWIGKGQRQRVEEDGRRLTDHTISLPQQPDT